MKSIFQKAMQVVDENGKLFGIINLFDAVIYIFLTSIFIALLVYSYFPVQINEHTPLLFQVYYKAVPLGARDLLVVGNELEVHNKGDRAIITEVRLLSCVEVFPCNFLVTYNGTLEIGQDGQYIFNDFEITPGRELYGQIHGFYVYGTVYSVNIENSTNHEVEIH